MSKPTTAQVVAITQFLLDKCGGDAAEYGLLTTKLFVASASAICAASTTSESYAMIMASGLLKEIRPYLEEAVREAISLKAGL